MATHGTPRQLEFEGLARRRIVAGFDGGRMTPDGGALLLREADHLFNWPASSSTPCAGSA